MFDKDLIGNAFLYRIQKEREDFIGIDTKQRKRNYKFHPVTVFQLKNFENHAKTQDLQMKHLDQKKKEKASCVVFLERIRYRRL
jgi:hypothetical protein